MTSLALSYERYRVGDEYEWAMALGSTDLPPILFLPPLFEELNRTRALIAATMRGVATGGYCCWLPDLPGTGESERRLEDVTWDEMRGAARAIAVLAVKTGPIQAAVSLRGGALLDDAVEARCRWRLAPVGGAALLRDLDRSGLAGGGSGKAGYRPGPALSGPLSIAEPRDLDRTRTLRLASDRGVADRKVAGSPLWRRSEPENAPDLAADLAADIIDWIGRCDV